MSLINVINLVKYVVNVIKVVHNGTLQIMLKTTFHENSRNFVINGASYIILFSLTSFNDTITKAVRSSLVFSQMVK